ncbi:MAG: type IV secretory system conjugative DNA transfer family protein [Clostridiales bacterium]|nr:type IV secretory system conjugative DNA transfer family protein [Clostridiales bacterium]
MAARGDRTNANFVILGVAGVGKSTAAKSLVLSEYMSGTKIIGVDPERELKDMCRRLNGDWINCGDGSGGRINSLEPCPAPVDDEDGERLYCDDGTGMESAGAPLSVSFIPDTSVSKVMPNCPQSSSSVCFKIAF